MLLEERSGVSEVNVRETGSTEKAVTVNIARRKHSERNIMMLERLCWGFGIKDADVFGWRGCSFFV